MQGAADARLLLNTYSKPTAAIHRLDYIRRQLSCVMRTDVWDCPASVLVSLVKVSMPHSKANTGNILVSAAFTYAGVSSNSSSPSAYCFCMHCFTAHEVGC